MMRTTGLTVFAVCILGLLNNPQAAGRAMSDQERLDRALFAALRADSGLRSCHCIRSAVWINESYPRIVVDAMRWRTLSRTAQTHFNARALQVAEQTYLTQFGTPDQYEELFVVDQHGRQLSRFHP